MRQSGIVWWVLAVFSVCHHVCVSSADRGSEAGFSWTGCITYADGGLLQAGECPPECKAETRDACPVREPFTGSVLFYACTESVCTCCTDSGETWAWFGDAPWCEGECPSGWERARKCTNGARDDQCPCVQYDNAGDGSACTLNGHKVLCRNCQGGSCSFPGCDMPSPVPAQPVDRCPVKSKRKRCCEADGGGKPRCLFEEVECDPNTGQFPC
jgi:hypothetical protein